MKYIFTIPAFVCFVFLLSIIAPEAHWMLDNLSSFLPQAALGALACAFIAPAIKAYGPAIVLAGYAGIFGYMSYDAHTREQGTEAFLEDYTVLHWNALYNNKDITPFTEYMISHESADFIQIQEFSLHHVQGIEKLVSTYTYSELYPEATSSSQGAAIFSKYPIKEHTAFSLDPYDYEFVLSTIIEKEEGKELGILSLHTKAPVNANWSAAAQQLL